MAVDRKVALRGGNAIEHDFGGIGFGVELNAEEFLALFVLARNVSILQIDRNYRLIEIFKALDVVILALVLDRAELTLGAETDSWDVQGTVLHTEPVPPLTLEHLQAAAQTLTGMVRQQIPPVSAKKINGRKMYDLAREGTPVQDRFNSIEIFEWKDISFNGTDKITFTLHCSCGTYVRSLGLMLARALGTTGHLTALRRLSIGGFSVENAFDGNKLKTTPREEIVKFMQEPVL